MKSKRKINIALVCNPPAISGVTNLSNWTNLSALIFVALEAWNRFEPMSPECINQNRQLSVICDDGSVLV